MRLLLCVFGVLMLAGCTSVKPWEKGTLARYEMSMSPDLLEQKLKDHTYFAKEAASSGHAISGGGCGCN